jgi:hypothetical protein
MHGKQGYKGRTLIIATRHKKDQVIAPIFASHLKVQCFTPAELDTDRFGTFSGETERLLSPLDAARSKCQLALALYPYDLALASEGSFGPHPELGFLPVDEEVLLLVDKKNHREIFVRHLSVNTNFNGSVIKTEKELLQFASLAHFPSHGLILRKNKDDLTQLVKGIVQPHVLMETFKDLMASNAEAYLETDMRAHYNPTRMQVIKEATEKLVTKLRSCCPRCAANGYAVVNAVPGLPCETCGLPTRSIQTHLYRCEICGFEEEKKYPHNKRTEEAGFCDYCNP